MPAELDQPWHKDNLEGHALRQDRQGIDPLVRIGSKGNDPDSLSVGRGQAQRTFSGEISHLIWDLAEHGFSDRISVWKTSVDISDRGGANGVAVNKEEFVRFVNALQDIVESMEEQ